MGKENLKIKIKKLYSNSVIPSYANPGDAGLDLTASWYEYVDGLHTYGTGIAVSLPENHVGLLFPRSSITKYDLRLSNSVGVLDQKFLGEIIFKFDGNELKEQGRIYKIGDRIGQLLVIRYPTIEFEETVDLGKSERGQNGWGSSGA